MKSIWKGAISFGLVSIPVQLFSATEERGVSFKQVHAKDGGRIRYRRICEIEDKEVPYSDITKAYEADDGNLVMLTAEELAELPLPSKKIIDVVGFVETETFDPIQFARPYYIKAADASAAKPYVLLREALERSGRVAVVKVALRSREAPALLRVHGSGNEAVLVLHTMLWPDEVRSAKGIAPDNKVTVRKQELEMVDSFMDALGGYDPADFTDEYRHAVEALVASKEGEGPPVEQEEPAEKPGKVIDLMAALEASVEAAKSSRGENKKAAKKAPAKKAAAKNAAPAKKTTAKKTTTKKTAAKKTTAKKTTAKKSSKKAA